MSGINKTEIKIPKEIEEFLQLEQETRYASIIWTPQMDAVLKKWYGKVPQISIINALKKMTGVNTISRSVLTRRLYKLGLKNDL